MRSQSILLASVFVAMSFISGCADNGETTPEAGTETQSDTETQPGSETETAPSRTFDSGFIDGCEGSEISYHRWSDDGEPYATLVYANGRGEYTDKYHHLIPLIDRNIDIVFFDHIGQGRSSGLRGHVNDIDAEHACDLQQVIQQLTDPDLPLFLLAHSMGSMATTRTIQQFPDIAVAVGFSSPLWKPKFPGGMDVETARNLAESQVSLGLSEQEIIPSEGRSSCEEAKMTHDCELYDQFADDPLTIIPGATWGAGLAFINAMDAIVANLENIQVPIFVQASGDDWSSIDPAQHAVVCDALNAIEAERCTMVVHETAWHELLFEVDAETYLNDYLDFFDSHLPQ